MTAMLAILFALQKTQGVSSDWPEYGKGPGGERYVQDCTIDKSNVKSLKLAWNFHTGDISFGENMPFSAFECTPIFLKNSLYVVSPYNRVFSLDPDSGKANWIYDPKIIKSSPPNTEPFACRGVSSWENPATKKARIFLATYDARLIALDSETGKPISTFGDKGEVQLRKGVGTRYLNQYNETSAPCVVGNLVVVGSSIADNVAVDMPSGVVRAYSVISGKLVWGWDPCANFPKLPILNDEKAMNYLKGAKTGAGNAWATLSADPARDMIFIPTGSASPDFFGGLRKGNNADADSVVALQASTGKKLWSFQTVHHDLWDYDVPAQPLLCDVQGKPAVVVMTKMGFVFVLNRVTGKPLLPVEERPVPTDGINGEYYSPTQPFPVLPEPLVSSNLVPWATGTQFQKFLQTRLDGVTLGKIFQPITTQKTVIYPGNIGGCNWSGGSFDPETNTLFVNTNNVATIAQLVPPKDIVESGAAPQTGAPFGISRETFLSPNQVSGATPPWGELHAINLATGQKLWSVPLGFMPQYKDIPEAKAWGSLNFGGSFATSSGLVFISASSDPHIRAFDSETGKILWEFLLPAGGQAAPMTFVSPKSGKTYVIQCAGGHHGLGTRLGDSVVAFELPAS